MALHVRIGDNVLVIAGKDKGKSGKIVKANPSDNTVVVSGVNIISKHKKPRSAEDKGGIQKMEGKIDASNVQIICPECKKATRVAHGFEGDTKYRQCKKCGASLDKAAKKETKKVAAKTTAKVAEAKKETKATKTSAKAEKTTTKTSATKKASTTKKSTAKSESSK